MILKDQKTSSTSEEKTKPALLNKYEEDHQKEDREEVAPLSVEKKEEKVKVPKKEEEEETKCFNK